MGIPNLHYARNVNAKPWIKIFQGGVRLTPYTVTFGKMGTSPDKTPTIQARNLDRGRYLLLCSAASIDRPVLAVSNVRFDGVIQPSPRKSMRRRPNRLIHLAGLKTED